ncbi:hypothetical protein SYN65AY6A5_06260 [Synechococcus sp. 65AY6A5]|jgi:hypothetical protein|uniref:hypothetical protein n=1 Tax=Synechococcus sp. 65AY6A5 TaxID=1353265 RepID=UPI000C1963AC|nr:hypothetical protein [Synechococcus sp. 65AY6A5]PIK88674.1 hypothetical protein SYN65AY6A5_06260 [Synechococcus sp. 65AY6A5]
MKALRQPKLLVGLALLTGVLALLWPMLQRGYPITHSTHFNLSWAFQYQRQFFGGQFYPRWLEYSNFGYGNPTFAFYAPLCMVAPLPFRLLGLDMPGSLVASMGLAMAVFGLGLYVLLRQVLPWALALGLALLSMAGPYWLVDIYQRGAIGEVWAIAILPWIFWASLQTICRPQSIGPVAVLALSYGLLTLSHLPTLLVFTLIWLPLPWVLGGRDPFWPRVGRCYLGFGLGLGWAAFYLLPAFWDQRHVQVDFVNFAEEYTPHHRLMLSGLMQLQPRWTEHWFESNLVGYWVWMAAVLVGAGLLVFLEWLARRTEGTLLLQGSGADEFPLAKATLLYSLGASLVALLMMTDLLAGLYEWVLPLRRIQFSWRWMAVTAVTVPWLLGSLAGWGWGHKRLQLLLLVGIGLAMGVQTWQGLQLMSKAGFDLQLVQTFQELAAAKQFPHEPQERPGIAFLHLHWRFPDGLALVDALEYRPRQATLPMPPPQVDPLLQWQGEVEDPAALLQVEEWRYGYRRFRAVNPTSQEQSVALRTFYYPAWRLQIDGRFRAAEPNGVGLLQVRIPPGEHRVEVRYLGTAADWLGWILTGVAGVLLVELRRLLRWRPWLRTPEQEMAEGSTST